MVRRVIAATPDGPLYDGSFGVVTAAHELKAPVALMRQLALELRDRVQSPADMQLLDQLILTSERSLRLTSNLTKTARLTDGLFELEPLNPQQLCEEVAHELTPLYRAHDRRIDVRTRRHAPLVVANRDLLRRVLLNFGDNALRYGSSESSVSLSVTQSRGAVQVGVRDQGPILPSRSLTQGVTVTGRPDASGLGLLIAQRFAEMMHGSVGTRRHRNGMTFYVTMMPSEQLSLL